jgi:hypothetical protein
MALAGMHFGAIDDDVLGRLDGENRQLKIARTHFSMRRSEGAAGGAIYSG